MENLSRRFFLGGAVALIAAKTFVPSVNAMGNMPTIYGNGIDDDSFGLAALFRNEPVIFSKDQIGVDEHKGIVFHNGNFIILYTIDVPKDLKLEIIQASFTDKSNESLLEKGEAFFRFNDENYDLHSMFRDKSMFVSHSNRPLIDEIKPQSINMSKMPYGKNEHIIRVI